MDAIREFINVVLVMVFDSANMAKIYETIKPILLFENTDMSMVNTIYAYFVNWGFYMVLIFGLMEVVELYQKDTPTTEQLIKVFFKFGIGIAILENGGTILNGIISLGNTATIEIADLAGLTDTSLSSLSEIGNRLSIWEGILMIIPALLLLIVTWVSKIVIRIQMYTRKIEMMIRLSFASIGMADLFGELTRSNGIRYLKKLFALALQGVAIVGIYAIINVEQTSILSDYDGSVWAGNLSGAWDVVLGAFSSTLDLIVLVFVAIGATSMAKQVVNDALGV